MSLFFVKSYIQSYFDKLFAQVTSSNIKFVSISNYWNNPIWMLLRMGCVVAQYTVVIMYKVKKNP